jgi:transposase InsO family protein
VGRSTIRRILKAAGLPPVPQRPTSWRTFLKAHWGVIAGADFFTTEVWTWQGLVTYYTVFVIDLASRRVRILGSTPHPNDLFMRQVVRMTTAAAAGPFVAGVWICDRDRKWSRDVRRLLVDAGIRVVRIPERAPNANAYAERFVRSIKEECLERIIPIGERHFRARWRSLSTTIIANGITKGSTTGSSRDHRESTERGGCSAGLGWAGC